MSEEQKSVFEKVAEQEISPMVKENEALVKQLIGLEWALTEMSKDPKMTAKAWRRAIKGFHEIRKGKPEPVKYEHPIEEAVAKNLHNQIGIGVLMATKTEQLMKASTEKMRQVQKMLDERQKALAEAEANVNYAVQPDETGHEQGGNK